MAHGRKEVRDAFKTALENASIVASGRVFTNRVLPIAEDALPALNVYAQSERSDPLDMSTSTYRRVVAVVVEVIARGAVEATVDNTLEDLIEDVEDALADNLDLASGGECVPLLASTELTEDGRAGTGIVRAKLTYETLYTF